MYELDRIGAFTDARRYAFDGTITDVTRGKDPRDAGFQQPRLALQRPAFRRFARLHQICSSENESFVIAFDDALEPFRSRSRSDKNEQRSSIYFLSLAAGSAVNRYCLKPIRA